MGVTATLIVGLCFERNGRKSHSFAFPYAAEDHREIGFRAISHRESDKIRELLDALGFP